MSLLSLQNECRLHLDTEYVISARTGHYTCTVFMCYPSVGRGQNDDLYHHRHYRHQHDSYYHKIGMIIMFVCGAQAHRRISTHTQHRLKQIN